MSRTAVFLCTAAALGCAAILFSPKAPTVSQPTPRLVVVEPTGAPASTVDKVDAPALAQSTAAMEGGAVELSARISHPLLQSGINDVYAQIDLTARAQERGQRQPVNLAVVIDRSGSMHGDKLERAKQAALHLISKLEPSDRLAIVDYGGDTNTLPSMLGTEASKAQMRAFVNRITDNGDTNISAGLYQASAALREHVASFGVSRIILLSDGQPTSGTVSVSGLTSIVETFRSQGLTVSALGVGEDFNENLMSTLANTGAGFYGYIENGEQLATIFGRELDQATSTVARQVEVTVEVPEGVTVVNVFGHTVSPGSRVVRLPLYDLAGGQTARLLVRLSARAPEGEGRVPMVTARLSYHDVKEQKARASTVALVSELSSDKALVTAKLDKDVAAAGMRALGAMLVTEAAQAYQSGRTQEAAGMFDNIRRLYGSSADALGGDTRLVSESQNVAMLETQLKGSSGAQLNHYVKTVQKKGLKDFGNSNTY